MLGAPMYTYGQRELVDERRGPTSLKRASAFLRSSSDMSWGSLSGGRGEHRCSLLACVGTYLGGFQVLCASMPCELDPRAISDLRGTINVLNRARLWTYLHLGAPTVPSQGLCRAKGLCWPSGRRQYRSRIIYDKEGASARNKWQ